ncbi:Os02g0205900 [Oryza sativa Japonica Group]|uniref:rRNA N-glycosylase n=2 Tax=Oryza sativa subsp. japonica TaxID=39947 RepID=A0A8J8XYG2_ORYSJ|nr:hypothetical protein OsJ_05828 [Oryza sativa Japonica Group]BAS77558.1 Os02g0205900 [Oryza sativa Japonica Group]
MTLLISHNYMDLIDGGNENPWKVPRGKQSAMEAVVMLASYDAAKTTVEELRRAFVRLHVMICEALQFKVIWKVFRARGRWEEESFRSSRIYGSLGTALPCPSEVAAKWISPLARSRQRPRSILQGH